MSNYSYNDKVILIVSISVALICLVLTIYLAINRIKIQKVVSFQKVFVLDTTNSIKKDYSRKYEKFSYNPPLIPDQTGPNDWNSIAQDLSVLIEKYDRLVLVIDSEPLVYTASALSFMLENLVVPIVVTIPKFLNGALENKTTIPEVMVYNGKELLRSTRTVSLSEDKFISPKYPPLTKKNSFPKPKEAFKMYTVNPKIPITIVKVHPSMNIEYLAKILETGIQAVILELMGENGIPLNKEIISAINGIIKKGVLVVSVPQYQEPKNNKQNLILQKIGVIHLGDITASAAFGKLLFLLSNVENKEIMGELLLRNFRGEMTKENKMKKEPKKQVK